MKLSDMFSSLSRGAQDLEKRMGEWENDLSQRSAEWMASGRQWLADAQKRDDEISTQMKDYVENASDMVKEQWAKAQKDWDSEVTRVRGMADKLRADAAQMTANERAEWSEAYAAQMVNFAAKMQEEAGKAVAEASQARAKASEA
jgi:hypothetical protein